MEAGRSSFELRELGINNQLLVVNGVLSEASDGVSKAMFDKQQAAMKDMP